MKTKKLVEVKPLDNCKIYLRYSNGLDGEMDLTRTIEKNGYKELLDKKFFSTVTIDPVTNDIWWNEKINLCKNAIYKQLELKALANKFHIDIDKI